MKKLNVHNLKAKEIKKLHTWLRALIQILYFLFLPSVYTAAFAGVKYIFTQIGAGEAIGLTSFVTVLIVLCAYTILFGRFFCGFACAFGSLGDGIHAFYIWCFKKRKKKPVLLSEKITEKLSYLKYLVLTVWKRLTVRMDIAKSRERSITGHRPLSACLISWLWK